MRCETQESQALLSAISEAVGGSKASIRSRAYILRISLRPFLQSERLQVWSHSVSPRETGPKAKGK
jgi:hypothetical protein